MSQKTIMLQNATLIMEDEGIKYYEAEHINSYWGTKNFVQLLDGRTLAEYDHVTLIPSWLNDGDEITLKRTGVPTELHDYGEMDIDLWGFDSSMNLMTDKTMAITLVMVCALIILSAIIFIGLIMLVYVWARPCGEGWIQEINECWKVVVAPDCSYAQFNGCVGPDNNEDGYPDGEMSPWEGGGPDWWMWIIYGAIAIGAVVLAVKLIPILTKPKEKPPPREKYHVREV